MKRIWGKWFRIGRLTGMIRQAGRLLLSRRVPVWEKLLFLVPAGLYWLMPDALPYLPVDDAAITLLLMGWFVNRWQRKYPAPNR